MLVEGTGERVLSYYVGRNINWCISGSHLEMCIYFEPLAISTKKINMHIHKKYLPTYLSTNQPVNPLASPIDV